MHWLLSLVSHKFEKKFFILTYVSGGLFYLWKNLGQMLEEEFVTTGEGAGAGDLSQNVTPEMVSLKILYYDS